MKNQNTGERLIPFVKNKQLSALMSTIGYGIVLFLMCLFIFYIYRYSGMEANNWAFFAFSVFVIVFFSFLTYTSYLQYTDIRSERRNPRLKSMHLKLLNKEYWYGSEGDTPYYRFSFEKGVTIQIDAGSYKDTLHLGETYSVRMLQGPDIVFDIKTLDGKVLEDSVETSFA